MTKLFVYKKLFKVNLLIKFKRKMFVFILFILFFYGHSFEFSKSNRNTILHYKDINDNLNEIIENNEKIKLFNNPNQDWAIDCLKIKCSNENIYFDIISYNDFYNQEYNKNNQLILINDFMINYGRTLTINEKEKILNYNESPNLIFHINDYNNLVLKDNEFIKNYEMYNFPYIEKSLINNYIFNLIDYYNYHSDLQIINWKKYKIEKLNFRKLEDLIFKLHLLLVSNKGDLNYLEALIKNELSYLDKKYYD